MNKMLVAGGGPAGFFAAIHAKQVFPDSHVCIIEAAKAPLAKVKISGGGRCNVTHHCFDPKQLISAYPRGDKELLGPFHRFHAAHVMQWFEQRGVKLKTEADGRVFPVSDCSETIIECLLEEIKKQNIELRCGEKVTDIKRDKDFAVTINTNRAETSGTESFDKVLLATGSSSIGYRLANALGHSIVSPAPSLFTFELADHPIRELSGLSVQHVQLQLVIAEQKKFEQSGPLLITHWGLSGPAIIKLSAWAAKELFEADYQALLKINWVPTESVLDALLEFKQNHLRRRIRTSLVFEIPQRLWKYLLQSVNIPLNLTWGNLSKNQLQDLHQALSADLYQITGKGVFKEEFVTCGGVELKEVDFRTMESKICPGLYFAGEILNIDGITGGFNFQSAWTTGWIVGQSVFTV